MLAGCSSFDAPQTPAERAQEYWNFKVSGDLDKAYAYETPEFRKSLKLKDYVSSESKWIEARVGDVQVSNDQATVQVTIRFALVRPWFPKEGVEKTIQDRWVLIDNVWYHQLGKPEAAKKTE